MTEFQDEVIVGRHESGIELIEGLNTSLSSNYCSNCRRKIHCYVRVDRQTKEAIIHKTCTNDTCECKCRTHYACKICGHLHPHGQLKCDYKEPEPLPYDPTFENILKEWRESHKSLSEEKK